jgi:hypothetical protein
MSGNYVSGDPLSDNRELERMRLVAKGGVAVKNEFRE